MKRGIDPPALPQSHVVQPGETLVQIAKRYTGRVTGWAELYNRNKAEIGSNPNLLAAGMVLRIPERWGQWSLS